jgi:putative hemolysin
MINFKMVKEKDLIKFRVKRTQIKDRMFKLTSVVVISFLLFVLLTTPARALLNPSAVYCTGLGYNYVIVSTSEGERGLCQLPNNESVNAWEFLKGKVAQEYSYCHKIGYEIKTVQDKGKCSGIHTGECAICISGAGDEVEVTKLMGLGFEETKCGDGNCGMPENFSTCPQDCLSGGYDGYCDGVPDGKCDPDCLKGEDPDCIDSDKDSVPDYLDECPKSILELNTTIDGCNSGVKNVQVNNGCTMSDLIVQCANSAKNHGKFISCVSDLTNSWLKAGLINGKEKGDIQSCAAKAKNP